MLSSNSARGLWIDEYPVLGPVDHAITENMTISVESKMNYLSVGVVGIEDALLTAARGSRVAYPSGAVNLAGLSSGFLSKDWT